MSAQNTATILNQALPYINRFKGKTVVIKYGGNAMTDPTLKQKFCHDVALLQAVGIKPVVVHGGGPQMGKQLHKIGKKTQFIDGLRVTDDETMEVAEMVLSGSVNKSIVQLIHQAGVQAVGISGADGHLIEAQTLEHHAKLGRVGQVKQINQRVIEVLINNDFIPVIAPVGINHQGQSININADAVASAIAQALKAEKFMLLTNTPGLLDENGHLLTGIDTQQVIKLIDSGVIHGGMLPKIQCVLEAVEGGVKSVQIIDGRVPHSILIEIFTDEGVGSYISQKCSK